MTEFVQITRESLGNRNFNSRDFRIGDKIEIMYIDSWINMSGGSITRKPGHIVVLNTDLIEENWNEDRKEEPVLEFSYGVYENAMGDLTLWPCSNCTTKIRN